MLTFCPFLEKCPDNAVNLLIIEEIRDLIEERIRMTERSRIPNKK
jgi:hypothetical protein